MALGRHWEWRGFGTLSVALREKWDSLEHALPDRQWYDVVDRYLWVPSYGMNAKIRSGLDTGDCLKVKRLRARWGQLQLWHEDPQDVFDFPLQWANLEWLARELHIDPPRRRRGRIDFDEALALFRESRASVQLIEVHKHRQARLWHGSGATVLIEIAEISRPEVISSLCLESTLELTEWSGPDRMTEARDSVQRAVDELQVQREPLRNLNYVEALSIWASGDRLGQKPA